MTKDREVQQNKTVWAKAIFQLAMDNIAQKNQQSSRCNKHVANNFIPLNLYQIAAWIRINNNNKKAHAVVVVVDDDDVVQH